MAEPFHTSRLVEFHDTDMAGIMHFASFFVYMESAEHELLRTLGFSVHSEMDGERISFPRVSASCQYTSPALSEQVLDIAIQVMRIGEKSVTYEFHFTHAGRPVAVLSPYTEAPARRVPGNDAGRVIIHADFDDPLPEFDL